MATPVPQLIDAFLANLKRKRRARNTLKRYEPELRRFQDWLQDSPIWAIQARDIELGFLADWEEQFRERNGREPSAASVRSVIQALTSFYSFCERFDYLEDQNGTLFRNPMNKIEQPKVESRGIQWLRHAEDEEMLSAPKNIRERVLVCFLRYTGMRLDEALSLINSDIDLDEGTVYVGGRSKTEAGLGREIPLNPELVPVIRDWIAFTQARGWYRKHGPFLVTRNLTPMKPQQVEKIVHRIAERANVREGKVTPHTLRRTFGSDLLNRDPPVRLEVVSKLLGHASTTVTEKAYAQLLNNTIRREMMAALR